MKYKKQLIEEIIEYLEEYSFQGKKNNYYNSFSKGFKECIYEDCDNKCFYCRLPLSSMDEKNPPHIDHIIPRFYGGTDDKWNLVLACRSCNCSKGTKDFVKFCENFLDDNWKPIFNKEGLIINF